jgi:hypothetical protein
MPVRVTRSAGMLMLGIRLILTRVSALVRLQLPGILMAALALIACADSGGALTQPCANVGKNATCARCLGVDWR